MRETKEVTNIVDRLETFEEQIGITLEGLYAEFEFDPCETDDPNCLTISGELRARDGCELLSFRLIVAIYDLAGRVIHSEDGYFGDADSFLGFDTFSETIYTKCDPSNVSKIRVYPRPF